MQSKAVLDPSGIAPALYAGECRGGGGECYVLDKEDVPYTLKIRSGCEGGGKGALWQEDKSATLSTLNDQYLFQPVTLEPGIAAREGGHIYEGVSGTLRANMGDNQMAVAHPVPNLLLDDQGGSQISVRTDDKCPTLRAEAHGNVPCVMEAAGFCTEHSAQARGIGYQEECAPTLRAGVVPAVCVKTWDARGNGDGDTCSTITGDHENRVTDYTSVVIEPVVFDGANVTSPINASNPQPGDPCHTLSTDSRNYVVEAEPVYCLQGNGIDRADTAGCNGKGWKEDTCYTLNTIDRPAVVYAVDQGGGKSGANVSKDTAPTLCTTHGGEPAVAFIETPICVADHPTPKVDEHGVAYTLSARDYKAPLCAAYTEEPVSLLGDHVSGTLMARDYKGIGRWDTLGSAVCIPTPVRYIVRRLTPTECSRLQGFADRWGDIDYKEDFTDAEHAFWQEVRDTHAGINGKTIKEYSKEQMLKWYNKLHTDSAEYKLWGNGIALPPALYVLQGIAEALHEN